MRCRLVRVGGVRSGRRVGMFEFAVFWNRDEQEMRFRAGFRIEVEISFLFDPSFACGGGGSRRLPVGPSHPSEFDLSVPRGFGARIKHWAARDGKGMLALKAVVRVREDHFRDKIRIKVIARKRRVSRNTVRKATRKGPGAFGSAAA